MDRERRTAMIRLFHVHKHYGPKKALVDATLDIYKNEFLFINGPSGAGKTTLLKLLYLGERATQGQILVDGMNLARIHRRKIPDLRRLFGIVFQDYKLIPGKTVFENVALVLEAAGKNRKFVDKKTRSVLRTVGMEDRFGMLPPSLSGGEQQRVAVARALVGDPKILIADEPTGSLDEEAAAVIVGLLKGYHARGGTVLIATHDRNLLETVKGRKIHLREGRIREAAAP